MKKGWKYISLNKAVKKESSNLSINKLKDESGKYPLYGASGFVKNISFYNQKKDYISIVKDGAGVGRLCINEGFSSVVGTLDYLIPSDDFNINFLFYFLQSIDFKSYVKGSTIPHIYFKDYKQEMVPYLPIHKQKRIVEKLDTCMEQIDKAIQNVEQNIQNAKDLLESQLYNIMSNEDGDRENKKWGELCVFVRGPFGGSLKKSMFKEHGYAVYEQKHAIHNHFNQLRYFIDEEKFLEMKRFEVKPGDIIMSCSGVTLGRVAVIPEGIKQGIINQALLKLTPIGVDVHFLKNWLRSKIFQDIIKEYSGGAAIPNVPSAKILKDIVISVPSLDEQKEIVKELDKVKSYTESLQSNYQQELDALDELKKSILEKAFNGKL